MVPPLEVPPRDSTPSGGAPGKVPLVEVSLVEVSPGNVSPWEMSTVCMADNVCRILSESLASESSKNKYLKTNDSLFQVSHNHISCGIGYDDSVFCPPVDVHRNSSSYQRTGIQDGGGGERGGMAVKSTQY